MSDYTPIKLGRTGKEVHAGEATVTGKRRIAGTEIEIKTYRSICASVNSHDVNSRPGTVAMPEGTEVTCKKCLARIKQRQKS